MSKSRVLVSGAGVTGLATAMALRAMPTPLGQLDLIDAAPPEEFGRHYLGLGTLLPVNMVAALSEAGVPVPAAAVTEVSRIEVVRGDNGSLLGGTKVAAYGVDEVALHRGLCAALSNPSGAHATPQYLGLGTSVASVLDAAGRPVLPPPPPPASPVSTDAGAADDGGAAGDPPRASALPWPAQPVRVSFKGGRQAQDYDLILAADGIPSRLRSMAFGLSPDDEVDARPSDFSFKFRGHGYWNTIVPRPPGVAADVAVEVLGLGARLRLIPLPGDNLFVAGTFNRKRPQPDRGSPTERAAAFVRAFADWDVPSVRAALDAVTAECNPDGRGLPVQIRFPGDLRLGTFVKPPVVLLGDAAHASVPSLAMGMHQSLRGVLTFVASLRGALEHADPSTPASEVMAAAAAAYDAGHRAASHEMQERMVKMALVTQRSAGFGFFKSKMHWHGLKRMAATLSALNEGSTVPGQVQAEPAAPPGSTEQ